MTLMLWMISYLMTSGKIYEWMFAVKWRHWNIYEWICRFIHFYKNIVQSFTLNPFVLIFIFKNHMQEKETITNKRYKWKFLALVWLFRQYLGRASILRKRSPSRSENLICTGYWWKILIIFVFGESCITILKTWDLKYLPELWVSYPGKLVRWTDVTIDIWPKNVEVGRNPKQTHLDYPATCKY